MATSVIMPALELAQETGRLVRWLKADGETVTKGEPVMEIETDKATVEIEAPDSGILGGILAREGDAIPVGQTVAWILAPGESAPAVATAAAPSARGGAVRNYPATQKTESASPASREVSPLARNIALANGLDLAAVKPGGGRIAKADVLAHLAEPAQSVTQISSLLAGRLSPASPKARRLAAEHGLALAALSGTGPHGAALSADVLAAINAAASAGDRETPGAVWRLMAERMVASWTSVPHFYLVREVDAGPLVEWRTHVAAVVEERTGIKPTYTDLLVKLAGFALRDHPRLNAAWSAGNIQLNREINIGVATAVEDGLVVPVIRDADAASLSQIATQRHDMVERARMRKLRPADLADGTFTLTNLGMYKVDAFSAIVNAPQAAILAVGRIVERVAAVNGQPVVRPMMVLTLSCDHRVVDGARAAEFLDDLGNLIEDPWRLLT